RPMRPSPLMPMRMEGRKYNVPGPGPASPRAARLTDARVRDRVSLLQSRHSVVVPPWREPRMSHGNPGRTLLAAGPALMVCLLAGGVSFAGTAAGETGAPKSEADYLKPEDAARAFANAGRAVVRMPSGRSIVAVVADTP